MLKFHFILVTSWKCSQFNENIFIESVKYPQTVCLCLPTLEQSKASPAIISETIRKIRFFFWPPYLSLYLWSKTLKKIFFYSIKNGYRIFYCPQNVQHFKSQLFLIMLIQSIEWTNLIGTAMYIPWTHRLIYGKRQTLCIPSYPQFCRKDKRTPYSLANSEEKFITNLEIKSN